MQRREGRFGAKGVVALMAIAVLGLVWGCGNLEQSPLVSTNDTGVQGVGNSATAVTGSSPVLKGDQFAVAFGPAALAKTSGGSDGSTMIRWVQDLFPVSTGGNMGVSFPVYGDESTVRVESASFKVHPNSMGVLPANGPDGTYDITMEAHSASTLGAIVIKYSPCGLVFSPNATLVVTMAGPVGVPSGTYPVNHVYASGAVEVVTATVTVSGGITTFTVPVPGFSEYDWDDVPEAWVP